MKLNITVLLGLLLSCQALAWNYYHDEDQVYNPVNIIEQDVLNDSPEVVDGKTYSKDSIPESFMDSLFGYLVNGDKERSRMANLLNSETINPPKSSKSSEFKSYAKEKNVYKLKEEYDDSQLTEFITKQGILYSSKLKLPEADYTDDLYKDIALFGGLNTFARRRPLACFDANNLNDPDYQFDVAIVGAGFDTATSFRPGARFGPTAIRHASQRIGQGSLPVRGLYNRHLGVNNGDDFMTWVDIYEYLNVADCGDVPMIPFDNRIALDQLYRASRLVHKYPIPPLNITNGINPDKVSTGVTNPKIITLGGDHTISLLTIKTAYEIWGEITVLHFDSHLDSWDPKYMGGSIRSNYLELNHGTFLHYAAEKGYIANNSMHIGIRAPFMGKKDDLKHDIDCGFDISYAREIDIIGITGVIEQIKKRVYGPAMKTDDTPVFITFDIDSLDPVFAPATGTEEPGGYSIREVLNILDGLEGINLIGADLVEVAPPYDTVAETTSLNAVQIIDSFIGLMAVYKHRQLDV